MKIHFCDLCNESVPHVDLEAGRAFLRKGRVVCAKCDALMSGAANDAPVEPKPDVLVVHGGSREGPPPAGPVHVPPAAHGRQGSGAGIGIAVVALLLAGAVAVWSFNEQRAQRDALQGELGRVHVELADARTRLDRTGLMLRQAREEEAAQREELVRAKDEENARIHARLGAIADLEARMDAGLAGLGERIEALESLPVEVRRHDTELIHLQQRYSVLADDLREVRALVADVASGLRASAPGGAAPPNGAGETPRQPAWWGLVERLASPDQNERWLAVQALEETRDPAAADPLLPLLRDPDIFMRLSVARALGTLRSPASIGPLIETLEDGDAAVREMAYVALKSVTGRDFPFDPLSSDAAERAKRVRAWQEWWKKERERLAPG